MNGLVLGILICLCFFAAWQAVLSIVDAVEDSHKGEEIEANVREERKDA